MGKLGCKVNERISANGSLTHYYALPIVNNFCDPGVTGTENTKHISVSRGPDMDYYGFSVSATWQGGQNCESSLTNHDCVSLLDSSSQTAGTVDMVQELVVASSKVACGGCKYKIGRI